VRQALITASRKDQNPAVRMKALESLRDAASDDDARQALLDALEHDANPGVRVEAVNVLVGSLRRGDTEEVAPRADEATQSVKPSREDEDQSIERVVRVLQQLQRKDPSRYVRLRSAAALRQIGPREVQ
jgi:HEAT repeats